MTPGRVRTVADIWTIEGTAPHAAVRKTTKYIIGAALGASKDPVTGVDESNPLRASKFKTPEALQEAVDKYFKDAEAAGKPVSLSGLSCALEWSRDCIIKFGDTSSPVFDTIRNARRKIREYAENYLYFGKNQVGAIFNLKCNWAFQDTQRIEYSGPDGGPVLMIARTPQAALPEPIEGQVIDDEDPLAL